MAAKAGKKLPKRAGKKAKKGYHMNYLLGRRRRNKPPGWATPKKDVKHRCEICGDVTKNKINLCNRAKSGKERTKRKAIKNYG